MRKLLKIVAFLQKLQKKAFKKGIYSFDVRVMNCDNGLVLSYACVFNAGSEPCVGFLSEKFYKDQCKELGNALKAIRAFLNKNSDVKDVIDRF